MRGTAGWKWARPSDGAGCGLWRARRAAHHQRRPGERQVELRVGEYMAQLGHFVKHDRFAQHLALGAIGQRETGTERDQQDAGEYWAARSSKYEAPRQQNREKI